MYTSPNQRFNAGINAATPSPMATTNAATPAAPAASANPLAQAGATPTANPTANPNSYGWRGPFDGGRRPDRSDDDGMDRGDNPNPRAPGDPRGGMPGWMTDWRSAMNSWRDARPNWMSAGAGIGGALGGGIDQFRQSLSDWRNARPDRPNAGMGVGSSSGGQWIPPGGAAPPPVAPPLGTEMPTNQAQSPVGYQPGKGALRDQQMYRDQYLSNPAQYDASKSRRYSGNY